MQYFCFQFYLSLIILLSGVWCQDSKDTSINLAANNDKELFVKINNGILKGKDNGYFYSYESVPYGESPTGNLRFEAPKPYQQKWQNIYDATKQPEPCMQWDQFHDGDDLLTGVEDCLKLNIYKPKQGKPNGSKYPVMVFIHGGCFMHGNINGYHPEYLMNTGKIMVVNVIYRLGPLGFLSTEDDVITGNFGLKDQQLALKWIQDNIARFGGDPKKIMLTGFSAGGASTHLQSLHPLANNLMKAAVSFSGAALNPWVIVKNARSDAFKLAELVKCPTTENVETIKNCLQNAKAEDIVRAVKHFQNYGYNPFTTFGPVVEHKNALDAFMTQHPRDLLKSGKYSQIPWIAAYTAEDGAYNAAELLQINPKTGREYMYDLNENWLELAPKNLFLRNFAENSTEYAMKLKKLYLNDEDLTIANYLKVQQIYTDIDFKNGILESIELQSKYSKTPIYGYVYDNPANWSLGYTISKRDDIQFGTSHFDDVSLIYNFPIRGPMRPDEKMISQKFVNMLIEFAETGKPSFGVCKLENNVGQRFIKMLWISKDKCETLTPERIQI